jgi:predicted MPP superfamily phosphohydrolase
LPLVTRRRFLRAAAAVSTTGVLAVGVEGALFEPNHLQVLRIDIPLARLPRSLDGLTIAQLSDFHYDEVFSIVPIRKAIKEVHDLNPDLIVLTGDFVTVPLLDDFLKDEAASVYRARAAVKTAPPCAELLGELRAPLGVFAVLGNHDVASDPHFITKHLEDRGIAVLRNHALPIQQGSSRFWLAGVDDVVEGKADLNLTLASIPQGEVVVLLCHEPDFADKVAGHSVDLQLSGHSHGGQIWLPGIGAPWLPPFGQKYPRGKYRVGQLTLYTNIGLGTIRAPIRLNCRPEVSLFTLRMAPS